MGIGQIQIATTPMRVSMERTPEQQSITQEHQTLNLDVTQARLHALKKQVLRV